jgi:phage terminase large subunit-like protein
MPRQTKNTKLNNFLSFEDARTFSRLSIEQKTEFVKSLTDAEAIQLRYLWEAWARDNQLPPRGKWVTWLNMGGRGAGKTRAGAEWIRMKKETSPYLHLIGRTAADVRDVMIDGESGILAISPPWDKPVYQRSKRRLVWDNGAQAITFSADEPESLRGPQCSSMWLDEIGAWQYAEEAYDMASFGLRLGNNPQACLTTTPRVTKLIKRLASSSTTKISRSTTYDNRSNLAEAFFNEIIKRYENTRLGRQELEGLLIEDNENALWNREMMIDAYRVTKAPDLVRIGVAIDPAVTSGEDSDETGIIVGGVGKDGHAYILADASLRASPMTWASEAVAQYHKFHADRMIAEGNQGGELIETTIRTVDKSISFKRVHAKRGKYTRAEPVAALYEKGMVHHVGLFPVLEDEQCQWEQGEDSPNHLDALCWLLTELMLGGEMSPDEHVAAMKRRVELARTRTAAPAWPGGAR